MKNLIVLFTILILSINLSAQEETPFVRKGRVLIETGYGVIGGFSSGTGVSLINIEDPITTIGADIGYFVNNNLALKLNVNSLTGSKALSLSLLSIGAKYYIAGVVPIQWMTGSQRIGTNRTLFSSFDVGYGIKLADNIYLEPTVGILLDFVEDGDIRFKLAFAMFI